MLCPVEKTNIVRHCEDCTTMGFHHGSSTCCCSTRTREKWEHRTRSMMTHSARLLSNDVDPAPIAEQTLIRGLSRNTGIRTSGIRFHYERQIQSRQNITSEVLLAQDRSAAAQSAMGPAGQQCNWNQGPC